MKNPKNKKKTKKNEKKGKKREKNMIVDKQIQEKSINTEDYQSLQYNKNKESTSIYSFWWTYEKKKKKTPQKGKIT